MVLERLRPLLEDATIPKYGQNIKYDFIVLQRQGVTMQGLAFDSVKGDFELRAGNAFTQNLVL